jgi:lipopolysaccharide/colanic/teichoic acid biosynthesis glycosyltransferase
MGDFLISVIVPVKNGLDTIGGCLESLLHQTGLVFGQDYEIIVVDDGSTDDTAGLAESFGVRVHRQVNAGPAAARNAGAQLARGRYLAFTDADCAPAPDWLVELLRPFDDPRVVGVKGVYRLRQSEPVARFVQQEYAWKYQRMARQETIDFIDTYSAAYRKAEFLANGGFDPIFPRPSVEDQEFSFRMARKGYRLVFTRHAAVYHRHDRNIVEYFRRKWGIGYWKMVMLRWMPEKTFQDSHTPPSQRWQIVLLGLAGLLLPLALIWSAVAWVALAALLAFLMTCTPFMVYLAQQDMLLAVIAPFLLATRTLALGGGLLVGLLFPPRLHKKQRGGLHLVARWVKRLLDLSGALVGLIFSIPILLIASVVIKLTSPGTVFYCQERAGENGKPFMIIKLRTMVADADQQLSNIMDKNPLKGSVYKLPDDPRVTRVGRILRRWSLDELPQFWNVLIGEMSLVGPRPEEMWLVAQYTDTERQRLAVKPGLTGPMQVNGRGALDMEARLALEIEYIDHYSIWKDLVILARSIPTILSGKGAY